MDGGFLDAVAVVLLSMVKFAVSPLLSYHRGFGFWETIIITSAGGILGVLVFYRTSGWIMERARIRRLRRALRLEAEGRTSRRRTFTRTNRLIVWIKRGHGLGGLAVITPVIISIPLGAILAAKYFSNDRRTVPSLISSVLIWAVLLSSFWTVAR